MGDFYRLQLRLIWEWRDSRATRSDVNRGAGLLGDAYVALSPGSADANLGPGDVIARTEPALNVADIIGRAAFGDKAAAPSPGPGAAKEDAR
jgi:phospholipid/cholesterol/gamma-HCH transport system substrate-binding protein